MSQKKHVPKKKMKTLNPNKKWKSTKRMRKELTRDKKNFIKIKMSFLGGGENTVARRDHHHHQSRRKDDEEKKKKKKRFSSVDDDDEEEAGTTEAKAKVGRMDALLERLETALAEEPRVVSDDDEGTTTTTTSASASLTNAKRKLEHLEIGLIAFAALLKTKGIDADKHEGLRKERKRLEAYKRKVEETKKRTEKERREDGEIKEKKKEEMSNKRLREEGEIPRANSRVASRFVRNALGGSRNIEKNALKQEAVAKLRRSIEEDVKSKFEEKVNERYEEKKNRRGSKGTTKNIAKPEIEEGEYSG